MSLDKEIFSGKTLSDLFGEIYDNSKETKEYMEIGVRNDEHLIKLATVIQRIETAVAKGDGGEFDFSDLQDLLEEQEQVEQELDSKQEEKEEDGGIV